jgi:hypothetical protein
MVRVSGLVTVAVPSPLSLTRVGPEKTQAFSGMPSVLMSGLRTRSSLATTGRMVPLRMTSPR